MNTWNAYRQVLADGDLTVRVFALWRSPGTLDEARELVERIAPFTHPDSRDGGDRRRWPRVRRRRCGETARN